MNLLTEVAIDIENDLSTHNTRYPKYQTRYKKKCLKKVREDKLKVPPRNTSTKLLILVGTVALFEYKKKCIKQLKKCY